MTTKQEIGKRMAACVDRVLTAKNRKEYERARRDYRKALRQYEQLTGQNLKQSFDPQPWSNAKHDDTLRN